MKNSGTGENKNLRLSEEKRVAIFMPTLNAGGAERMMLHLSQGIADLGYKVDVVLATAKGPHLQDVPGNVRLIDLQSSRVFSSLPALVRYLRHEKPNVMLSVMNHANVIAIWAKKIAGVKTRIIVSERNTLSISAKHGLTLRARIMPWLIKIFYPFADGIVAVSKGVADDLSQVTGIPRNRISVIYNPVITDELREKISIPLDHPWFFPGELPVILGVGRLREQKDFATLIRAFSLVRQNYPSRLMILGEGPERESLEKLISELNLTQDVSLPGFVLNPYNYMNHAAVFVLSSKWEGLPNVLIEALYCGAHVISTDCPSGTREILDDGRNGQIVPIGDVHELALAIEKVLCGKIATRPEDSWHLFEMDRIVQQYLAFLYKE